MTTAIGRRVDVITLDGLPDRLTHRSQMSVPAGPSATQSARSTHVTPKARKPTNSARPRQTTSSPTLLVAMTGRASPAKAALGDEPVFAYLRSLPQPQRAIAEQVDALAARTLPALQRCVKWGMAWYGVGDGWCFACGGFAGHVKLTFGRGTSAHARTAGHADRDGQGLARRGPRIRGRPRRTPDSRRG